MKGYQEMKAIKPEKIIEPKNKRLNSLNKKISEENKIDKYDHY